MIVDSYKNATVKIIVLEGQTGEITIKRGLKQGYP
jgi:hypothetical protein